MPKMDPYYTGKYPPPNEDGSEGPKRESSLYREKVSLLGFPGTLRDYFAGQALVGMGNWKGKPDADMDVVRKLKAEWSYAQADEMLIARDKNKVEE